MAVIKTAGGLIPSTVDTPLDARTRIAALAETASIEAPFLGMEFYCKATAKKYRVTSLKSRQIGALTVDNAAIDEYEEIAAGGTEVSTLVLIKPSYPAPIWPVVEAFPDQTYTESAKVVICNKANYATRVSVWGGACWNTMNTGDGIGAAFDQLPVKIDLASLKIRQGFLRYSWVDASGAVSDALSLPFPTLAEPTPFQLNAVQADAPGVKLAFLSAAEYNALAAVDLKTVYFVAGTGVFFAGVQYAGGQA